MRVLVVFTALVAMALGLPTFPWEQIPEMKSPRAEFLTVPLSMEMLSKPVVDCTDEELMTVMTTTLHTTVTTMVPEKCSNLVITRLAIGYVKYLSYSHLDTIYRLLHTHTIEELLILINTGTVTGATMTETLTNIDLKMTKPMSIEMTKTMAGSKVFITPLVRKEMLAMFNVLKKAWISTIETTFGTSLATRLHVDSPLETPFFSLARLPTELTHLRTMTVGQLVEHVKEILLPVVTVTDPSLCVIPMTTLELTTIVKTFITSMEGLTADTLIRSMHTEGAVFPVELKPLLVKILSITNILNPIKNVPVLIGTTDISLLTKTFTTVLSEIVTTALGRTLYLTNDLHALWNTHNMEFVTIITNLKTMPTMPAVEYLTHFLTRMAVRFSSIGVSKAELEHVMLTVLREVVSQPMETVTETTFMHKINILNERVFEMEMKKLINRMLLTV